MCVVKNCNYSGFIWKFYTINWFSSHQFQVHNSKLKHMHMVRCTNMGCKIIYVSMGLCVCPMQEMGMKFEHHATVALHQTSTYLLL